MKKKERVVHSLRKGREKKQKRTIEEPTGVNIESRWLNEREREREEEENNMKEDDKKGLGEKLCAWTITVPHMPITLLSKMGDERVRDSRQKEEKKGKHKRAS